MTRISRMWPFNRTKPRSQPEQAPKGTVDYDKKAFSSHAEFYGNLRLGVYGIRAIVTAELNDTYRHCRIGKITLKA